MAMLLLLLLLWLQCCQQFVQCPCEVSLCCLRCQLCM
jgi:hypothetical protein